MVANTFLVRYYADTVCQLKKIFVEVCGVQTRKIRGRDKRNAAKETVKPSKKISIKIVECKT